MDRRSPPPLSPAVLFGLSLTATAALGLVGGLIFTTFAANAHPPLAYYLVTALIVVLMSMMHALFYRWRHDRITLYYIYGWLVFEIAVLVVLLNAP